MTPTELPSFMQDEGSSIANLLIAVTFFYNTERLKYLRQVAIHFPNLSRHTKVIIVTNAHSLDQHILIRDAIGVDAEIIVPTHLGHPYLLTWAHLDCFRSYFRTDPSITHFCYIEDDIELKPVNIKYWLKARDELRSRGLIPSFMRYEIADGQVAKRSSDVTRQLVLDDLPVFDTDHSDYCYVNLPLPYQGMYLLDRELAEEHFFGPSSSPDYGFWGIREKAAQGLTFAKVPKGYTSRNVIGFNRSLNKIDPDALVHHLPNNYANNPVMPYAKIFVEDLFYTRPISKALVVNSVRFTVRIARTLGILGLTRAFYEKLRALTR